VSAPDAPPASLRLLAERALSRAAGAPLVPGNALTLLRDSTENYPAWLDAIEGARRSIAIESYILSEDAVGNRFADAMIAAAKRGVRVRLLQDWLGARGEASHRFWTRLRQSDVEFRWFNPFRFAAPLAWLRRNHRKSLVVDDRIGFVTGLCLAARWTGDAAHGIPPWRDTGVCIEGPAVADLANSFARTWAEAGGMSDSEVGLRPQEIPAAGDVSMRVVATEPATTGTFRLDALIAAIAQRRLWLTDAYFFGLPAYVQSLRAAALDGVDVRLLVPGTSDLGLMKKLGNAGFRPLLEAGIRVFEWNGAMLHAKTAVADGRWARVGSTNLNIASWMGNWELDVAVEDERFASEMERMYEADLSNSTELLLGVPRRRTQRGRATSAAGSRAREGSAVVTAGAIRVGTSVSAALGGHRVVRPAEARVLIGGGLALVAFAAVALLVPWMVVVPLAVGAAWLGVTLIVNGARLRRARARLPAGERQERATTRPEAGRDSHA
jgi:cardiolipin synthase